MLGLPQAILPGSSKRPGGAPAANSLMGTALVASNCEHAKESVCRHRTDKAQVKVAEGEN